MLRFRLRTLLIAVAVLAVPCAWVNYTLRWIEQRRLLFRYTAQRIDIWHTPQRRAPGGLWLLGESGVTTIEIVGGDRANYEARARRLFPEATVIVYPPWDGTIRE